jgi:glycerol-3-phosphate dehydrogenase (NAD(P)+)
MARVTPEISAAVAHASPGFEPPTSPLPASSAVAVLGAGSWGTALADMARRRGHGVRLWARDARLAHDLQSSGQNHKYLPGASLEGVQIETDVQAALSGAAWVLVAVPCAGLEPLAREIRPLLEPSASAIVVSGSKGLDPESGARPSLIWQGEGGVPPERFATLSGPNLAREMVAGLPASGVVASASTSAAQAVQDAFGSPLLRIYTSNDVVGVEMGGALKNIVAIAVGIGDGLGFGDNSKAALMCRAWHEMARLSVALGAREGTLYGLSGIGDLIATCASPHSRNHRLGCLLASGEGLKAAQHEVAQVAEGVHTTRAALRLAAQVGIEMPVTQQLARVLFEGMEVRAAVEELMNRQWRHE